MRMVVALSQALARAQRQVRELAFKGAESRLATLLLDLSGGALENALPPYKRRELADMIGVSTETAIRLLAKLKAKGAVTTEGRSIVFRDIARLKKIAQRDEVEPN